MTYMYPNYVPINMTSGNMLEPGVASTEKYGLFLYAEGWRDVNFQESLRRLSGVPVLFIPGNAGSYKQVRSVASESTRQFESGFTPAAAVIPTTLPRALLEGARKCSGEGCEYASRLDWFVVDFLEEYSALDSRILQDQTEFVAQAIEKILDLYKQAVRFQRIKRGGKRTRQLPSNVILFGHSMGGVAARAALFHPAFREGSVKTIVTLATPHRSPPVPLQVSGSLFYSNLNRKWREDFAKTGPLRDVIVVSISGGSRDTQVRTPLTRLDGIVPPRNGFSVSASAVPDVWLETDHQVIVWCNQLVVKLSKALLLLSDPATGQPHNSRVVRREILAAHLRSALPEALGWLPRGSRTGDLDAEDLAEFQTLRTWEKRTRKGGEGANGSGEVEKRKATNEQIKDGAGVLETELRRASADAKSLKSTTRLGPPQNVVPLEEESMVSELRGEDEGVDLEQGTGPEESASSSEEKADKERSDEEAERERNEERAERERDDWKTGEERNDEKAERERNDEKTERDRSDEKTETVRSDEKPCGGACSGASEFDESTEREVVSGPFLPLEKSERKQRCFAVKTAREGSAQTPEMVTSRSFVVVTDLEPCTELRIWMVRERASAEPGTGAAGSKAGRTETEKRAAESEQREAEQEGRGREAAGLRAPFAESDWRVAEPRLTETERRELEEEWQTAVGEGMSRLGVTRGAEERVQGERESGVESGVDGTERERNEPLGGAELERNEPLGGMKRERNELLGGTDRERNAGRGVREVTLQAGRLPSGSLVGLPGSDRRTWILRLLPADLADVDWVVIETLQNAESSPRAGPILLAQLLQPREGIFELGWRDLLATLVSPQVLDLPEGHSLWTELTIPLPLSVLPLTLRFNKLDCTTSLGNEGDRTLGTKSTCSASCSSPLVLAWDPSIEQERIWTVQNTTTLQTDGSPWGAGFHGQTNPPFVILSDPRCGYELSVSVASHLACFRFVATNAARIVSFAVALVLFILAVQSRPRKRGEPTPSPVAALSQLITLQTTRLTLQLGIRTLLLTLQTRVPLALVALVLAVVLVPLRHSLQAARAFRVAPADVYLLTSSAVAMAFAVGLVAILAVVQASLLRFVYWTVRSFGGYPKPSSSRPERKRCWRLSGTARLFLGCLSVPICLLIHPAIALLVVLIVQTLDTVSESCRNRDQGNRRTLVKEPGTESGTDDQSVVADGEQTVATEVATAMPRGSTNGGHVSVQDQCEAALQRQSGRLLLAFLNFVMTGPPGFASLPHVLQRWRAPAVLDSLLVVAPIVEALLSPNKRAQSERNGSWSSETFKSYLYVLLGLYTCYEGLLESPLGVAPVFAYAALVELFLSYRDKSWI